MLCLQGVLESGGVSRVFPEGFPQGIHQVLATPLVLPEILPANYMRYVYMLVAATVEVAAVV